MSAVPQNRSGEPSRVACARCGATFACEPAGDCWCKHEPVRLPMPAADEGCLCADCLRKAALAS
jgi:hypothetical protein